MNMDKNVYRRLVKAHAPRSPILKNCARAFLVGGAVCVVGQILRTVFLTLCRLNPEDASALTTVVLVFLSVLLTGLGVFDKIAKFAGAGTLVPVTGFANAVASPAIDSKSEGLVLGVGAKIFTVAGPVLLFSALSASAYGLIIWIISLF